MHTIPFFISLLSSLRHLIMQILQTHRRIQASDIAELSNKNIEQLRQKEHAKDDFRLHKNISHSSCVEKCKWKPNSFKIELIYMDLSHLQMKSKLKVKPSTSFFRWITYSWFGLNYVMFCVVFCKWKKFIAWKS